MKSLTRVVGLVAATILLAWHGLLLAMPHTHTDTAVPQEILACSASHPSSQTHHLHDSGPLLTAHPCLACLAGSTVARAPGVEKVAAATGSGPSVVVAQPGPRSQLHTYLPLLRGPPVTT